MLNIQSSNQEIINFIDEWVVLLSQERYKEAIMFLGDDRSWTAESIKEIIIDDGRLPDDRVTLNNNGTRLDGTGRIDIAQQQKEVEWHDENSGDIWYDLNINGMVSDLTATFDIEKRNGRMHIILHDIHVM